MNRPLSLRPFQVFFLTLLSLGTWLACSNQWRDGQLKVDSRQVTGMAREGIQMLSQSGADNDRFAQLYNDPTSRVYFAQGGGGSELGSPEAVAPIYNWQFMGGQLGTLTVSNYYQGTEISQIRVFLVEHPLGANSFELALMVHIFTQAGQDARTFYSNGAVTAGNGSMTASLSSAQGNTISVTSRDITNDGLLADFIQLDVYSAGSYIGKFATLMVP